MVLGSSVTNWMRRTRLYGARRSREKAKMASANSALGCSPGSRVTKALGTARRTGSGLGTMATSVTAGCSIRQLSSSNGLMR